MTTPSALRFEHHEEPFGIGEDRPRLSWQVRTDAPGWVQTAYELEVGPDAGSLASYGRVDSAEQLLQPWPARPLASRERAAARVRVWGNDDGGPSEWSPVAWVEAGLLDAGGLAGRHDPSVLDEDSASDEPASRLSTTFELDGGVASARLYASAHGIYVATINGRRVGQDLLAPGWTSYHHRLRYQTYDVADYLQPGTNVIGFEVADGWWRGNLGFQEKRNKYGNRTARDRPAGNRRRRRPASPSSARTNRGWRAAVPCSPPTCTTAKRTTHGWRIGLGGSGAGAGARRCRGLRRRPPGGTRRAAGPRHRRAARPGGAAPRRPERPSSTSARTSWGTCGSACAARPAPRWCCGTPRCWNTANSASARSALPGRPTPTSCAGPACGIRRRQQDIPNSPSTASATSRWAAGRASWTPEAFTAVVVHSELRAPALRVLRAHAEPAALQRGVGHARQLRGRAHRLPAAQRAARLDGRLPDLCLHRVLPLPDPRLHRVLAEGPGRRAGNRRAAAAGGPGSDLRQAAVPHPPRDGRLG